MASPTARVSLRDYQLALSERLQSAQAGVRAPSKLGLRVGGETWLVDLMEAGEVIPVPPISPVPLAQPWFRGVANVRGNLYSVAEAVEHDAGALPRQAQRDAQTDAAGRAGDESGFSFEHAANLRIDTIH